MERYLFPAFLIIVGVYTIIFNRHVAELAWRKYQRPGHADISPWPIWKLRILSVGVGVFALTYAFWLLGSP